MKKHLLSSLSAAAVLLALGTAHAGVVAEVEANDSIPTAQNIDSFFDVFFDINIEDSALTNTSTTIPHAQIHGTGNGTFDYYSFMVPFAGAVGIFDIDCGHGSTATCTSAGDVDTFLRLLDSVGGTLATNDDFFFAPTVDTGSVDHSGGSGGTLDSFIQYTFGAAGLHHIRVGSCCEGPVGSGGYILNVSIQGHATDIPEPGSLALLGAGLAIAGLARRRKSA